MDVAIVQNRAVETFHKYFVVYHHQSYYQNNFKIEITLTMLGKAPFLCDFVIRNMGSKYV